MYIMGPTSRYIQSGEAPSRETPPTFKKPEPDDLSQSGIRKQSRLLLVDDEPNIISAVSRILERDGYKCRKAFSGIEARDIYNAELIDLVITDYKMPGMNGMELLREIIMHDAAAKVIVASGTHS